ncbi:ABC transporter ATP-binding protein [candidate division KSB1 bacterium]|nr:ABC transporter ATP-binding protein [candidate division KSB1 bacterium]
MAEEIVIEVKNLKKVYGEIKAVDDVSFELRKGEIFGLIGPNGAGKTTTMECVEGIRKPNSGTVTVLGIDPHRNMSSLRNRIGIQLQQSELQKRIKVREAVDLFASLYRNTINIESLLDQLGLQGKMNDRFMNLSGGQKQRLFIALALINDPELVFLDELTTGLDPQARRKIWDLIKEMKKNGKTVFLTTHLMEEAERLCDRVAIIDHGKIVAIDSPDTLVKTHCPQKRVRFISDDPFEIKEIQELSVVDSVTTENGAVVIQGTGRKFESEITGFLYTHSIGFTDFSTQSLNLEDVFLKLTGHTVRE